MPEDLTKYKILKKIQTASLFAITFFKYRNQVFPNNLAAQAEFPTEPHLGPTGAQLGPNLAQLGPNWGPTGVQLGPIWNAAWACVTCTKFGVMAFVFLCVLVRATRTHSPAHCGVLYIGFILLKVLQTFNIAIQT